MNYRQRIEAEIDHHRQQLAKLEAALEVLDELDRRAAPPSREERIREFARRAEDRLAAVRDPTRHLDFPDTADRGDQVPSKPPTLSERIYAVAQHFGGRFTVPEVEEKLVADQGYKPPGKSRARIAMALSELERAGKVKRVEKPGGGKPHVFIAVTNGMQLSQ